MKKLYSFLFVFFLLISCATHTKSLNGTWRQQILGFEGEKSGYGIVNDSTIITLDLTKNQVIRFSYNDGYEDDIADSIHYHPPQLNFRKQNYNKSYNRYSLQYDLGCDCFTGHFKSYTGNTIKVKWLRN